MLLLGSSYTMIGWLALFFVLLGVAGRVFTAAQMRHRVAADKKNTFWHGVALSALEPNSGRWLRTLTQP